MPNNILPPLKTCTNCGTSYPATPEYFHKDKSGRFGLVAQCKSCVSKRGHDYRIQNADLVTKRKQDYYSDPVNKQHHQEYSKQYRLDNIETIREHDRQRAKEHRTEKIEYKKIYFQKNKAKIMLSRQDKKIERATYERVRRSRKLKAGGGHTAADIRILLKSQKNRCWWCGVDVTSTGYHVDHRIPLARGGTDSPNNLCIACPHCNTSKNDRLPHEWNGRLL